MYWESCRVHADGMVKGFTSISCPHCRRLSWFPKWLASTHAYSCAEKETVRVKCHAQRTQHTDSDQLSIALTSRQPRLPRGQPASRPAVRPSVPRSLPPCLSPSLRSSVRSSVRPSIPSNSLPSFLSWFAPLFVHYLCP